MVQPSATKPLGKNTFRSPRTATTLLVLRALVGAELKLEMRE